MTILRKLREPEHDRPSHVHLAPGFLQGNAGTSGLGSAILAGAKSTTGKCFSLLRSLVHDANQPTRGIFQTFSLSPVLSSALLLHAHNKARSIQHGLQRNSASGA